jgi:hypothetical protein
MMAFAVPPNPINAVPAIAGTTTTRRPCERIRAAPRSGMRAEIFFYNQRRWL